MKTSKEILEILAALKLEQEHLTGHVEIKEKEGKTA